jgi:hypothetical protein
VRSGPGSARTILLFDTISARPSKQPRMVGSTLGVYSFALIFVSARTNKRHHLLPLAVVLAADARASAFLAGAPNAIVLEDARAPAALALVPLAVVIAPVHPPR